MLKNLFTQKTAEFRYFILDFDKIDNNTLNILHSLVQKIHQNEYTQVEHEICRHWQSRWGLPKDYN